MQAKSCRNVFYFSQYIKHWVPNALSHCGREIDVSPVWGEPQNGPQTLQKGPANVSQIDERCGQSACDFYGSRRCRRNGCSAYSRSWGSMGLPYVMFHLGGTHGVMS